MAAHRLGALHDEVVDDHRHQVDADVLVLAGRLRDHQLGADAVGARDEHGVGVARRLAVEERAEAAEAAHRARPRRRARHRLDRVHELVARGDVDARRLVRQRAVGARGRGGRGLADLGDEARDGGDVRGALERLHPRLERLGRVAGQHRAPLLHEHLARVHLLGDEVHGAAALGVARLEHRGVHLRHDREKRPHWSRRADGWAEERRRGGSRKEPGRAAGRACRSMSPACRGSSDGWQLTARRSHRLQKTGESTRIHPTWRSRRRRRWRRCRRRRRWTRRWS